MVKLKIKKGDTVKVITGKDKGKIGEVVKVFPEANKVLVSGVNETKRHTKPSKANQGGIVVKSIVPIKTTFTGERIHPSCVICLSKTSVGFDAISLESVLYTVSVWWIQYGIATRHFSIEGATQNLSHVGSVSS